MYTLIAGINNGKDKKNKSGVNLYNIISLKYSVTS